MLAHSHRQVLNGSQLANSIGVNDKTIRSYIDLLGATYLVRSLQPWFTNPRKTKRSTDAPQEIIPPVDAICRGFAYIQGANGQSAKRFGRDQYEYRERGRFLHYRRLHESCEEPLARCCENIAASLKTVARQRGTCEKFDNIDVRSSQRTYRVGFLMSRCDNEAHRIYLSEVFRSTT